MNEHPFQRGTLCKDARRCGTVAHTASATVKALTQGTRLPTLEIVQRKASSRSTTAATYSGEIWYRGEH